MIRGAGGVALCGEDVDGHVCDRELEHAGVHRCRECTEYYYCGAVLEIASREGQRKYRCLLTDEHDKHQWNLGELVM